MECTSKKCQTVFWVNLNTDFKVVSFRMVTLTIRPQSLCKHYYAIQWTKNDFIFSACVGVCSQKNKCGEKKMCKIVWMWTLNQHILHQSIFRLKVMNNREGDKSECVFLTFYCPLVRWQFWCQCFLLVPSALLFICLLLVSICIVFALARILFILTLALWTH